VVRSGTTHGGRWDSSALRSQLAAVRARRTEAGQLQYEDLDQNRIASKNMVTFAEVRPIGKGGSIRCKREKDGALPLELLDKIVDITL